MNRGIKLPVVALAASAPLSAYADTIPHITLLYSFGGGFAGGLIGALLACWLCKRIRESKDRTDSKKF